MFISSYKKVNSTVIKSQRKYKIISLSGVFPHLADILLNVSLVFLPSELIFKEVNGFKVSGTKTDSLQAEQ